eukprot:GEMP01020101.1.p1 GENE.GEMP01020101.1~~GEMP01020101.1.p1  ORF type:complete len:842 (+),score=165.39 GEMP01020101.1:106-2631(+)
MRLFWCFFQPFARFVAMAGIAGLFFMLHHLWTEPTQFLVNPWNVVIFLFACATACTYVATGESSDVWILVSITGSITMLNSGNVAETRVMLLIFMPVIYTTMMLQVYYRLYPNNKEVGVSVLLFCNLIWHVSLDFVDIYFFLRTISNIALCSDDAVENKTNARPFFFFMFVTKAELRECTDVDSGNLLQIATNFPVMFFSLGAAFFHQQSFPAMYQPPSGQSADEEDAAPKDATSTEKVLGFIPAIILGVMRLMMRLLYGSKIRWNTDDDYRTVSSLIIARKRSAVISLLFVDMPFLFMRIFIIKYHIKEHCSGSCVVSFFFPLFFSAHKYADHASDSPDDGMTVFLYKNLICLGVQSIWLRICLVLENDLLSAMKKREVARMTGPDVDSDWIRILRVESNEKLHTSEDDIRRRGTFAEVLKWSGDVDFGMLNTLQNSSRALRAFDDFKSVLSRESQSDSVGLSLRSSGAPSSVGSWSSNSSCSSPDRVRPNSALAVAELGDQPHGPLRSRSQLAQFCSDKRKRRSSSPASPNLAASADTRSVSPHPFSPHDAASGTLHTNNNNVAKQQHQSTHRRRNASLTSRGLAARPVAPIRSSTSDFPPADDSRSKLLPPHNVPTPTRCGGLGSFLDMEPPPVQGDRIWGAVSRSGTAYTMAYPSLGAPNTLVNTRLRRRSSFPANLATSVLTTAPIGDHDSQAKDSVRSLSFLATGRRASRLSCRLSSRRGPRQMELNRRQVAEKAEKEINLQGHGFWAFVRKKIRLPYSGASMRKRWKGEAVDVDCTLSRRRTRVTVWRTMAFIVGACMANVLARHDFLTSFPLRPPSEFTASELQSILGIYHVP